MELILQKHINLVTIQDFYEYLEFSQFSNPEYFNKLEYSLKHILEEPNTSSNLDIMMTGVISNFYSKEINNHDFNHCYIFFINKEIKKSSYSQFSERDGFKNANKMIIKAKNDDGNNFPPNSVINDYKNTNNYSILTMVIQDQFIQVKCNFLELQEARYTQQLHDFIYFNVIKNNLAQKLDIKKDVKIKSKI